MNQDPIKWHRLFGLLLTDYFEGSPFVVELEKDLSLKQQFLDVVILRKRPGRFQGRLPDGFDNLATYNLITFKSHHESLDDWALKELTGHYVNYRKQISPSFESLLPEDAFRLYAVCSRYPRNLAAANTWQPVQPGVYTCRRGTDLIRVIVLRELPAQKQNAVLHLLSARPELIQFGATNYQQRSPETSTLLDQLFEEIQHEGIAMSYTMEDFRRDYVKPHLTPEQVFKIIPPDQLLKQLSPEERLKGLSPEEILKVLSPDEIEKYLQRLKPASSARKRKSKG